MLLLHMQEIVFVDSQEGLLSSRGGGGGDRHTGTRLTQKKTTFTFSKSLSFSPSLASMYLFEQCLRLGVIGTSSVCLPLQDESLLYSQL